MEELRIAIGSALRVKRIGGKPRHTNYIHGATGYFRGQTLNSGKKKKVVSGTVYVASLAIGSGQASRPS